MERKMNTRPAPVLDPWRFDATTSTRREKLWGAEEIAAVLGVSPDTVRRWHDDPKNDVPISKPAGRYFAFRSDLTAWLRTSRP
jgi:hypothetical protein